MEDYSPFAPSLVDLIDDEFSYAEALSDFPSFVIQRGKDYFEKHQVSIQEITQDEASLLAQGNDGVHNITIFNGDDTLYADCDCIPFEKYDNCKHIVAAFMVLRQRNMVPQVTGPKLLPQQKELSLSKEEIDFLRRCLETFKGKKYHDDPDFESFLASYKFSSSFSLLKDFLQTDPFFLRPTDWLKNPRWRSLLKFFQEHPPEKIVREFSQQSSLATLLSLNQGKIVGPQEKTNPTAVRRVFRLEKIDISGKGESFLIYQALEQKLTKKGSYSPGRVISTTDWKWAERDNWQLSSLLILKPGLYREVHGYYHPYYQKEALVIDDTTIAEVLPLLEQLPIVDQRGNLLSWDIMPEEFEWKNSVCEQDGVIQFKGELFNEKGEKMDFPVRAVVGFSKKWATDGYRFYSLKGDVNARLANLTLKNDLFFSKDFLANREEDIVGLMNLDPKLGVDHLFNLPVREASLTKVELSIEPYADLMAGHLSFQYEGWEKTISQYDRNILILAKEGEKRFFLKRDSEKEREFVKKLHELVGKTHTTPQGGIKLYYKGPESLFEISGFCHENNWTLKLSKSFKYYIRPRSVPGHLSIHAQNQFFEIKPQIKIDQQLLNLTEEQVEKALASKGFFEVKPGEFIRLSDSFLKFFSHSSLEWQGENLLLPSLRVGTLPEEDDGLKIEGDEGFSAFREKIGQIQVENIEKELLDKPICVSQQFLGKLRPYQKVGLTWLIHHKELGLGACLADDMGLGKTIQVIALLADHYGEKKPNKKPSLIVMPKTILHNWQDELKKFSPYLKIVVFHGSSRDSQRWKEVHLVLTSYGMVARESIFKDFEFEFVILDESQAIKNSNTQRAQVVSELKGKHRLILTGTPLENNLEELWSQFRFIEAGLLGGKSRFLEEFRRPIEIGQNKERVEMLRKLCKPFLLRRTKDQVLKELPPRVDNVIYCQMDEKQAAFYEALRQKSEKAFSVLDPQRDKIQILALLTRLRQAAIHPGLISLEWNGFPSAKTTELKEALSKALANNHRVLIFSQFISFLAMVKKMLEEEKIPYSYLDGQVDKRAEVIEEFRTRKHPVFLLSLKVGGVGLNLTEADMVFHLDPWWNPAVEDQATDRTHRIGQTKTVFNYKFVTQETIEEKIIELQKTKSKLYRDLFGEGEFASGLTRETLVYLFAEKGQHE